MASRAYPSLSIEFFSTARLKGKEYKITDKLLSDIFKIEIKDPCGSPAGFKAGPHWPLLTPGIPFKATGASPSFLSDVALGVIHKYISHTIFGKKESNKVSEQHVFILWSISQGQSVCMLQYLKRTLFNIRTDEPRGANLGHVVGEIAAHFNVQIDEPCMPSEWIGRLELYHAEFIIQDRVIPVHQRPCYIAYKKALETAAAAAAGPSHTTAGTMSAPSQEPFHITSDEGPAADDEPRQESFQILPPVPSHYDSYSDGAPVWFSEYEAWNDSRWTAFTEQNGARWTSFIETNDARCTSFVETNDARWTEQNRQWNNFVQDNTEHWNAHDSRWDTWAEQQYQRATRRRDWPAADRMRWTECGGQQAVDGRWRRVGGVCCLPRCIWLGFEDV
ncbi:translation initiation factor IF-2 [Striga asiatica]|uniref:Translation initiation factor IF-2 n=1 Tax=Striga asiatica TaxID=4170 RepID=A0A5A7QM38_STRAF|nr:translation initiation factor IF-2 [Striga asiatica]